MKIAKKCLFILLLSCIAISATACSSNTKDETEETDVTTEEIWFSETTAATTAVTSTTSSMISISETTTSESSTETTTTTETTTLETTTTETTTETTVVTTAETTTVAVETETAPETSPETETVTISQKFEPGIWWSTSSDGDRYFCFYSGSDSGSFCDQESGIAISFDYEAEENSDRVIFHINDISDNTSVTVKFTDSNTAVLAWENGSTETLKYQGLGNFDTFRFYSNLELCEMALDYYESQNAYRPEDSSVEIQSDRKILIQLYDNLNDHNTVSAWYTVDRFTAKGTDMMGNTIDLK